MKRPSLKPRQPSDAAQPTPRGSAQSGAAPRRAGKNSRQNAAPTSPAVKAPSRPRVEDAPGSTRLARILTLAAVALAVFLVVFSPLRSWMDQQQQARALAAQIAQVKAQNAELEAEIKRYRDPEYISRQARERLGYVKPGEVTYVVVDPPGAEKPQLTSGWTDKDTNDLPWFRQIVTGLEVAGAAPAPGKPAKTAGPSATPADKATPEKASNLKNTPTHN